MAAAKRMSLARKASLGAAKKNADGSMPPILVIELVSNASTTYEPKYTRTKSKYYLSVTQQRSNQEDGYDRKEVDENWVEKADNNTDKNHTFSCKDDKLKRDWKLTIHKTDVSLPSGALTVTDADRDEKASYLATDNKKRKHE